MKWISVGLYLLALDRGDRQPVSVYATSLFTKCGSHMVQAPLTWYVIATAAKK